MIAIMFMYFIVRTILFVRKSNREENAAVKVVESMVKQKERMRIKWMVFAGFNLVAFAICALFIPIFGLYLVGDIAYPVYKMSTKK
jgi:hypothetical protein